MNDVLRTDPVIPSPLKLKLTIRAQRVLTLAELEAQERGHNYIGAEHLLLGIIREDESIAAGVLESFGLSRKIRTAIDFIIGREDRPAPSLNEGSPRPPEVSDE